MTATRTSYPSTTRGVPMLPNLRVLPDVFRRCRKEQEAYVTLKAVAKRPCVHCGIAIGEPYPVNKGDKTLRRDDFRVVAREGEWVKVRYFPKSRRVVFEHYYCSWGNLLTQVVNLGHRLQGR